MTAAISMRAAILSVLLLVISLGLWEVLCREPAGVVPAAFYRHFRGMDSLGLELVDESFRALRARMREVRATPLPAPPGLRVQRGQAPPQG